MKTWTIAAHKGGVGKTTTAVNLAGALVRRGERVLMLDLDPHGSLTAYFGFDSDSLDHSSYALFEAAINDAMQAVPPLLLETGVSDLTLLGSSTGLVTLERRYGQRAGLGLVIKRALLSVATRFDYCYSHRGASWIYRLPNVRTEQPWRIADRDQTRNVDLPTLLSSPRRVRFATYGC